jgi:hypothetical protein
MTDQWSQLLADLPGAKPDDARADRIRSRCHAVLARRRRPRLGALARRRVWEPVVAGLGGVYLAAIIVFALGLYGVL